MSVFNFIKKLLPRIGREQVQEDLDVSITELNNVCIPALITASEYFKINRPVSSAVKELQQGFDRHFTIRTGKSPVFVQDINNRIKNLATNAALIKVHLAKDIERDIHKAGLSIRQTFLIRAASQMSFITRYIPSLLNYVYVKEAEKIKADIDNSIKLVKADQKYVLDNFVTFVSLFYIYTAPPKEFIKTTSELSDVYVNPNYERAADGQDETSKDPLYAVGLSGFIGNPIYQVRMAVAKWQNDRYNSAKVTLEQLTLRKIYLDSLKDKGDADPQLTEEIKYTQQRIDKYNQYLREVEEDLGVDNG